ncbi:DNA-3-methyladenine glycosylase family protein [Actinokineospora diospyrosa]|uniref:DNA-3-methyladenine glycosylase II n=1 Tax=Actinokineospora diospyrosa TaxID=103728 RepID=A0ABT1IFV0_9PSEU|nr:DNA-3-methyladenine glycosylase 2 family protein [Actinokineospora diospyrosa]MCP2271528.1 DNA-3-methyladenine glycosylase II [Actinokineospora diospyrosa]
MTDTTVHMFLPATPPFDFGATLRFLRGFPAMVGEQAGGGSALTKVLRVNGQLVGVRLSPAGAGLERVGLERVGLECVVESTRPVDAETAAAVGDQVGFHLGLDDDLAEFYALAERDRPFGVVVARLHGYHQVKFPSPLELLCWAILSQRVPLSTARAAKHALTAEFDNGMALDGHVLHAFPDLDQLLTLTGQRLAELVGNTRKAGYLHRALRQWSEMDQRALRTDPYEQVRERLLTLAGIGPWSATFLLIRGLGRMDHMPADREGLRAASKVYGHSISESEFAALAAHYGPWQAYWGHYLRVGG